ncbi:L,D-transpeptidase [Rhizobiaceae bacterium n13]|uniref:L,D-transpeptidase n=1 Tax=Ferirhizobium litorale TaxID=2927786 RepID=A0AAE3QAM9_9HYPH|nr:L,D-transpeptidase [Fererhizobium litorale]MDI7861343.1 L,D-transpeptidase [Fererhizobium litorale]MDI7921490.1 L,D-transpeptidase [Fererhizobium litorale]
MILSRMTARGASLVALVLPLAGFGCVDTSTMNADVFRQETAPIAGIAIQPPPAQFPPPSQNLFTTQFHRAYGLPVSNPVYRTTYGPVRDDDRTLPAIPHARIDPQYLRQEVAYQTTEKPGTIVVDTQKRYLYLVQPQGRAMRYGIGIGRDGYAWTGRGVIQRKQKWPRWTPPQEMVSRQPEIAQFSAANGGMNPGLNNPLGARALYIFNDGKDTLYRVHGTPDWQSIGKATSSGCVRMLNQDVIDLYDRVPAKSAIVVL